MIALLDTIFAAQNSIMERNILYFINPISGTKNKAAVLQLLEIETKEQGFNYSIEHTNAAGDYSYLKEKIATQGITDVVVCGGDGTVNQVAKAMQGGEVPVGIVPMGSGNGLAFAAKIPKQAAGALQTIFNGRSIWVDAFTINDSFSCMLCGLGFDAKVAHDFAKQSKRGLWTYAKETLRNFFGANGYEFSITANGTTFESNAYFISIANSNQFGNEFTIAPKASLNDGLLDIVIVPKINKLKLVFAVLHQIRMGKVNNDKIGGNNIIYLQTDKVVIENPERAPLHIDGDPAVTSSRFEIKVLPNAFKLLC